MAKAYAEDLPSSAPGVVEQVLDSPGIEDSDPLKRGLWAAYSQVASGDTDDCRDGFRVHAFRRRPR